MSSCRWRAEADSFSSVSLSDFKIIGTLGIGGFSRVELVGVDMMQYNVAVDE